MSLLAWASIVIGSASNIIGGSVRHNNLSRGVAGDLNVQVEVTIFLFPVRNDLAVGTAVYSFCPHETFIRFRLNQNFGKTGGHGANTTDGSVYPIRHTAKGIVIKRQISRFSVLCVGIPGLPHGSTQGLLTPLVVRPLENGEYEVISGHRRLHACKKAGIEKIPALIREMDRDAAAIPWWIAISIGRRFCPARKPMPIS